MSSQESVGGRRASWQRAGLQTPVVPWLALDTSPPASWDLPETGCTVLCAQTLVAGGSFHSASGDPTWWLNTSTRAQRAARVGKCFGVLGPPGLCVEAASVLLLSRALGTKRSEAWEQPSSFHCLVYM